MRNRKFMLITLFLFITILLCGCSQGKEGISESGQNNESSLITESSAQNKFVGSQHTNGVFYNMTIYNSLEKIVDDSTLIVKAHYTDRPTISEGITNLGETVYATQYILHVEQVLKGTCDTDTLLYWQSGKPDSDDFETKIKKDTEYLLFLTPKNEERETPVYDSVGCEQGVMEIREDHTLYSYYDAGIMPEYDGRPVEEVIQEIQEALQ